MPWKSSHILKWWAKGVQSPPKRIGHLGPLITILRFGEPGFFRELTNH